MIKCIELTRSDDCSKIIIFLNHVQFIGQNPDGTANVEFQDGNVSVEEPYEQVRNTIRERI